MVAPDQLRAKVTGVTVGVLALGLVVTGIGTMPILRNLLIDNVESQLPTLVTSDLATITPNKDTGGFSAALKDERLGLSEYFVAVYDAQGALILSGGGAPPKATKPAFPASYPLATATIDAERTDPLVLHGADGSEFRAAVAVREDPKTNITFIQVVALSLDEPDRIIATFFGVFTTVALVTIIIAALATRGLVTLTFRRLGRVESTAMAIAAGDFSQRLTDLEPTTEVGRLNGAINTMLDRSMHRSRSGIDRSSRCAASSATRVTSCAPRS